MPESTSDSLENLRSSIDSVDQQLLGLLKQRLELVEKVGKIKHRDGLPIYAPQREKSMLAKRRGEAEKLGVPPQLIEDILRRLMRESYQNEKNVGFKKVNLGIGQIVIIGGKGRLGSLFRQMFELSGYQVQVIDKEDWHLAASAFRDAGLVIVSVPIPVTCQIIRGALSHLPSDCVLADLTSVKSAPMKAMMEAHSGPVVGLHPMFGSDIASMAKQVLIICHGRKRPQYQWLLEQMKIWGAYLVEADAEEHDKNMQVVQALRHFSTFVYGYNLYCAQVDIDTLLTFSSPIYRLELAMVGRLFAQDADLYADIIFAQQDNIHQMDLFSQHYQSCIEMLKKKDRKTFVKEFNQIADWLGDFAIKFQKESQAMLQAAADMKID